MDLVLFQSHKSSERASSLSVAMSQSNERRGWSRLSELAAWSVHLYTSVGLTLGLFALIAAVEGDARRMFLLLFAACFVDATDGTLARRFDVLRWTPQFDGRKLDDITDYLSYVFIPIFFAHQSGLLPYPWVFVSLIVLSAAAYGFCHAHAKTGNGSFTGFPSYWNILVFYLYVLKIPPPISAAILVLFAGLVFVRIEYVSAITPPVLLWLNTLLLSFWLISLGVILWTFDDPNPYVVYLSLAFPLYHLALSFILHVRRRWEGSGAAKSRETM